MKLENPQYVNLSYFIGKKIISRRCRMKHKLLKVLGVAAVFAAAMALMNVVKNKEKV